MLLTESHNAVRFRAMPVRKVNIFLCRELVLTSVYEIRKLNWTVLWKEVPSNTKRLVPLFHQTCELREDYGQLNTQCLGRICEFDVARTRICLYKYNSLKVWCENNIRGFGLCDRGRTKGVGTSVMSWAFSRAAHPNCVETHRISLKTDKIWFGQH